MTTNYPISGFWVYTQPPNQWGMALDEIKSFGASKILQFGPALTAETETTVKGCPPLNNCIINGVHAYDAVLNTIRQSNSLASIRSVYSLSTQENFGNDILQIGSFDQKIVVGDTIFWVLAVPSSDPGAIINPSLVREYDLIFVVGQNHDAVAELLTEADTRQMNVYLGMPVAMGVPQAAYQVEPDSKPVFFELLNRILASYRSRHFGHGSFTGLYQSFEVQVPAPDESVMTLYQEQHALVRTLLPRKKIIISPYWEARKLKQDDGSVGGFEPDAVKDGFIKLAQSNVDIIAPQDGRGVGKVGLFWPYQANETVPPEVEPALRGAIAGTGPWTFDNAYRASTRDFYRVCRETVDTMFSQRIELWANLEAFEPGAGLPCASFTAFQRTTKKRLDQAIMFAGTYGSEQISFMWSGLYECAPQPGTQALKEEIRAEYQYPIAVDAFRFTSNNVDGVIIRGYGITEGSIRLTFFNSLWQIQSTTIPVSSGWINPDFGLRFNMTNSTSRYHTQLQEVWIPFAWTNMAPDFWLHIESINPAGVVSNHILSLKY